MTTTNAHEMRQWLLRPKTIPNNGMEEACERSYDLMMARSLADYLMSESATAPLAKAFMSGRVGPEFLRIEVRGKKLFA